MLLDGMHHPRRSTPDDRACPPRRPRRNSLVSLHDSLRQAGLPARRGSDRPQGVDRASARRTCSSLRASCQSSAIQGSRLDSFVASRFALSHDFPPAQAPNFRRFAAQSVKWAVGQFGTIPALFSPRCLRSARVSMAANEVLARVADVASSDLLDFIVELAHRLPLRYRCHRDHHGVCQGRPADAEACHRRLPTSSEGL